MQDRICQIDENLLQRTAGPYIRVMSARFNTTRASDFFRCASDSGHAVAQVRSVAKG
jgi:hypothetical protein